MLHGPVQGCSDASIHGRTNCTTRTCNTRPPTRSMRFFLGCRQMSMLQIMRLWTQNSNGGHDFSESCQTQVVSATVFVYLLPKLLWGIQTHPCEWACDLLIPALQCQHGLDKAETTWVMLCYRDEEENSPVQVIVQPESYITPSMDPSLVAYTALLGSHQG